MTDTTRVWRTFYVTTVSGVRYETQKSDDGCTRVVIRGGRR